MEECRFCQIIKGNRKNEEIIYEDENFLVITDKYRRTSVGSICLLIPKQHVVNILELPKENREEFMGTLTHISKSIQKAYNCKGIRIWTAVNKEAGQSILHFHVHILPCKSILDRLVEGIPGLYDIVRKIIFLGKNEIGLKRNFEMAEKIRTALITKIDKT